MEADKILSTLRNFSKYDQSRKEPEETSILSEIEDRTKPYKPVDDFKPLFHLVEDILNRAIHNVNSSVMESRAYIEADTNKEQINLLREKYSRIMDQISYTIAYNTSSKENPHETVVSIIKILKGYSKEAKLILTLTAFALNYGECWHLALIYSSDQLAKSISMVKQVADNVYRAAAFLATPLEAVNDLVLAMMELTRCIFRSRELGDQLEIATNDAKDHFNGLEKIILISIYWTIRSLLASASQITSLTSLGLKYVISSTEKEELQFLKDKLNGKKKKLEEYHVSWQPKLEEATIQKRVDNIKELLQEPQLENIIILRAIVYYKDDQHSLIYDCKNKQLSELDVLRKKFVLLLISDLDISQDDIDSVNNIYSKSKRHEFETVWIPIVEHNSPRDIDKRFKKKREAMQWYTVRSPSLIAKEVIKLAKDEWKFEKQPIIVVIDPQGQVSCPNAFPMIRIWKNLAYPFTLEAEEALWKDKGLNLEVLVDDIFPPIRNIKMGNNCVCLYGGEDMDWINMFTSRAASVAESVDINLKMVFVGKSESSGQVQANIIDNIRKQNLSDAMDRNQQLRFWGRIRNLMHSRLLLGKTIFTDPIMQEINSLLLLDASDQVGWAAFLSCNGDGESLLITKAKGKQILDSLIHFSSWKRYAAKSQDFVAALEQHLKWHTTAYTDILEYIKCYEDNLKKLKTPYPTDCKKILKALISKTDDSEALYEGSTKTKVKIDVLRPEGLVLLVSDLDISPLTLGLLQYFMEAFHDNQKEKKKYEIVWLPIVDPAIMPNLREQFEALRSAMPWYSVLPSLIDQAAINFIKNVLRFDQDPILVVIDKDGQIASPNALPVLFVQHGQAISLSTSHEQDLWKDPNQTILRVIFPPPKVDENGFICLYGGEDINWIRKFTKAAKNVESAGIPLKITYMGKKNPGKSVQENLKTIKEEKLSDIILDEIAAVWIFWQGIENVWKSKYQIGKTTKDDQIMLAITKMLSLDSTEGEWVFISRASLDEMAVAKGSDFLNCFMSSGEWKKDTFLRSVNEKLHQLKSGCAEECHQLVLPQFAWQLSPEIVDCSDCHCTMEKFITFKCCGHPSILEVLRNA